MIRRVFLLVLDSLGIGEMPDAAAFGDNNCNTMRHISQSPKFHIPNLQKLGIGKIEGLSYLDNGNDPHAALFRMAEKSRGKDTTVGHWEMAGVISPSPFPTFPDGFPSEIIDVFIKETGRGILCNRPASGTEVIKEYGDEHRKTGKLIVYTSADSVFQIAAHEDVVPPEKLYEYCRIARRLLTGKYGVGRVIARPFVGESGNYTRTENRRDFSLEPTGETVLDVLQKAGKMTISVGKISDIFAARGITEAIPAHNNEESAEGTLSTLHRDFNGLCFANFVDFDSLYGHRQDVGGYAAALTEFDRRLPEMLSLLREDDLLIITADHGCDPADDSTDHTREYVPLLIIGERVRAGAYGTLSGFTSLGRFVSESLGVPFAPESSVSLVSTVLDK